jgi:hypothetical protein
VVLAAAVAVAVAVAVAAAAAAAAGIAAFFVAVSLALVQSSQPHFEGFGLHGVLGWAGFAEERFGEVCLWKVVPMAEWKKWKKASTEPEHLTKRPLPVQNQYWSRFPSGD